MVLVLAVTACGGDDDAAPSTTSTSATSTPTSTTSTTSRASTPSTCPEDASAAGESVEDPVPADVDGDGADDDVVMTIVDDRSIALQVDFAAGGRTVAVYDDPSVATFGPIRVARVADVDSDGDDDLWVVVGSGAAVEIVSLVLSDGCQVVRPVVDGRPNSFPVGASVGFVSGIECTDLDDDGSLDGFLQHEGENSGDSTYDGRSTEWRVDPADDTVERGDARPFSIEVGADDTSGYAELRCS